MNKKETDFGFKKVARKERQGMVNNVFDSVADKYDLMNDLMSFGLHRLWKVRLMEHIDISNNYSLLDLAAGSGDISFSYLKKAADQSRKASCVISDINPHMLQLAKDKAIDEGIKGNTDFAIVNAEKIPFSDNRFNFCTIGFGIRNVTNIQKALDEIYRVLKPGGKFICLEFSDVNNKILRDIYDKYSFHIIPKLGKIITGDEDSYEYLVESIRKFPDADSFKKMIENSGFQKVNYEKLTNGVVAIHTGWKI